MIRYKSSPIVERLVSELPGLVGQSEPKGGVLKIMATNTVDYSFEDYLRLANVLCADMYIQSLST